MSFRFLWKYFTFRYGDKETKPISFQKLKISLCQVQNWDNETEITMVYFSINTIPDVVSLRNVNIAFAW